MSTSNPTLSRHPLFNSSEFSNDPDRSDALNNAADVLTLLSDLLGSESDDYITLNSNAARRGMWILLEEVSTTLRAVSRSMAPANMEEPS